MKVDVYFNLHKNKLSVRSRERASYGKVINHVDSILLKDCTFVVNPAGRKRVLKEQRKNVHAYVRGEITQNGCWEGSSRTVTYNPYKYDSFVYIDTEKTVSKADYVVINGKEIMAYSPT